MISAPGLRADVLCAENVFIGKINPHDPSGTTRSEAKPVR
jgi:hypothetical protein